MTKEEFTDMCAIDCLKSFLDKLPMVGLPENPTDPGARYNLVQKLTKDAWELSRAMAERRQYI